jgi:hypothetical protein
MDGPIDFLGLSEDDKNELYNLIDEKAEDIGSPEAFLMGAKQALTMIAYGYPELVNPTPGDMLML